MYDGEWKDGEWHGWGTWFNVVGDVKFRGCFQGNEPVRARSKDPIKFTNYQSGSPKKIAYDGWQLSSKYQKEKSTEIIDDEIIETLPKNQYLIQESMNLRKTPSRERAKKSKSSSHRGSGRNLPTSLTDPDDKRPWNYSTKPGRNYYQSREFTVEDSLEDDENQYFTPQQQIQGRKGNINHPKNKKFLT